MKVFIGIKSFLSCRIFLVFIENSGLNRIIEKRRKERELNVNFEFNRG